MSYDSKQSALCAARHARSLLKSSGWKIDVFENLGWYWHLSNCNGLLSLSGDYYPLPSDPKKQRYHCMFSMSTPGSGDPRWTDTKGWADPNRAVAYQFKLVEETFKREQKEYQKFFFLAASVMKSQIKRK